MLFNLFNFQSSMDLENLWVYRIRTFELASPIIFLTAYSLFECILNFIVLFFCLDA